MVISKGEEDQIILNGEGHTTFMKGEKFGIAALYIKENALEENVHIQNFRWVKLKRKPLRDCWVLLRWYFSRS